MSRVAAIDCGTNSIRLLIAEPARSGFPSAVVDSGARFQPSLTGRRQLSGLVDVVREMRIVRLGEGVDRTGRIAPAALERARVALAEYAAAIRAHEAERVRMVATSATRDAANRAEFVAMVRAELGIEPEVITGYEEAALTYAGAASVLDHREGALLVADIGGGSTELVRSNSDMLGSQAPLGDMLGSQAPLGGHLRAHSMDVGCVRMTERHLHDDPPTAEQIEATVADLRAAVKLARADVPLDPDVTFVGVAGTVTTIAAIAIGLDSYRADVIHGTTITAGQVADVTDQLLHMTHADRAALPVMHPGRVDVIGGGALVLRTLVEETGVDEVIASEHDILDGIALGLAEPGLAEPGHAEPPR